MDFSRLILILALAAGASRTPAQVSIKTDNRLPDDCVELRADEPLATDKPWQLPKSGNSLYDDAQQALVKDAACTHATRFYERGAFVGYHTLSSDPKKDGLADKQRSQFTHNSTLGPDEVELAPEVRPEKSDHLPERPTKLPPKVPFNFIAVHVYQGQEFIGWTYMVIADVATLHEPE